MADMAVALWGRHMRYNPADPSWINRDRFVLSNGHASMLLYALLHLTGYDVTSDDLRCFRRLGSRTPGHPEHGHTPGVETTTGPLGQGLANAVGMAVAERTLAGHFNRPGHTVIDHNTYVFLGDGCLMEGISHEVCSLAGTLGLGKLIAFWDDNRISIDGSVGGWFTEDVAGRFRSYGWQVIGDVDGQDSAAVAAAIELAKRETAKPSVICCRTTIGYGSPNKAGSYESHGAPFGEAEVALIRKQLDWTADPFVIPDDVRVAWDHRKTGGELQRAWQDRFDAYAAAYPELAEDLRRRMSGDLPPDWAERSDAYIAELQKQPATLATRQASHDALTTFGAMVPELLGGSADLTPASLTRSPDAVDIGAASVDGNYLRYGVREFGMTAIMNGIALYGGFIPFGGTFLMFMEYARNAVRMAALMRLRTILVYTHDSIGIGEDGPTHQPVEQLASLRLTPNMETWRGCDRVETAVSWQQAIERRNGPTALVFTRQAVPQQSRTAAQVRDIARGGYVLIDCDGVPDVVLIASGSEVAFAVNAAAGLRGAGTRVRVVSMPCPQRFDVQEAAYRDAVLPPAVRRRVAIEASIENYWRHYVGLDGLVIGMNDFGTSAPGPVAYDHFGFSTEKILRRVRDYLS
jgi:transketolase